MSFRTWLSGGLLGLVLTSGLMAGDVEKGFHWVTNEKEGYTDLLDGKQPVVRYMHAFDTSTPARALETYKVYNQVFGPGTDTIITKGQGGLYTHHRGMYVGWNKTKAGGKMYDFWHCKNGAHLKHAKFVEKTGDADSGSMTAEIHWNDAKGKPVIIEHRTLKASRMKTANAMGWQLDWSTKLVSRRGEINLDGDRQHAGFQFRADQPVAEKKAARYIRPDGFPQQAEAFQVGDKDVPPKHVNLNWLAMTFPIKGKQYTVEYLEDPALPEPSRYSERPYGRFGAFFSTDIDDDHPLMMRYRVNVLSGKTSTQAEVQKRYDAFVKEIKGS